MKLIAVTHAFFIALKQLIINSVKQYKHLNEMSHDMNKGFVSKQVKEGK